jgi:hypothetical protein
LAQHHSHPFTQQGDTTLIPFLGRGSALTLKIFSSLLGQLLNIQRDMLPKTAVRGRINDVMPLSRMKRPPRNSAPKGGALEEEHHPGLWHHGYLEEPH